MSYDQLRKAIKETWNVVPEDFLLSLVRSMKEHCEAVIAANEWNAYKILIYSEG